MASKNGFFGQKSDIKKLDQGAQVGNPPANCARLCPSISPTSKEGDSCWLDNFSPLWPHNIGRFSKQQQKIYLPGFIKRLSLLGCTLSTRTTSKVVSRVESFQTFWNQLGRRKIVLRRKEACPKNSQLDFTNCNSAVEEIYEHSSITVFQRAKLNWICYCKVCCTF